MNATRLAVWISVLAFAVATLVYRASTRPCQKDESAKVAFITGGGDSLFWQLTAAGARATAKQYNVDLKVQLPTNGAQQQSEILENLSASDFDRVAISPRNPEQQEELLSKLAAEVHLVTCDSDAPGSNRICYMGSDNFSAGRLAAKLTKEAIPKGGKVALLVADFQEDNAVLRVLGYQEEMQRVPLFDEAEEQPAYEVLKPFEDSINKQKCRDNIRLILQESPDLDAFVGMFSYHGPALLEVLKELNLDNSPQLTVFDEEEAVLTGLASGQIFATVVQDPFKNGYESVRMISTLNNGSTIELPIAGTPLHGDGIDWKLHVSL